MFAVSYNDGRYWVAEVIAVDVAALAGLLADRRYAECRTLSEELLRCDGLSAHAKAQASVALSRSLQALGAGQEALSPGELALHFGRESMDYDLVGSILCHLSSLCLENGLHKRGLTCLEDYFTFFHAYTEARDLEGWVLSRIAHVHQLSGRSTKALEYFARSYRWHEDMGAGPQLLEQHRADLIWQCLRLGHLDRAEALLQLSRSYLELAPNDIEARARYLNSAAYREFMTGQHGTALQLAAQVVHLRGVAPQHKAQGYLTLHLAARSRGLSCEAVAAGMLAKIQAGLAHRTDLESEVVRSLLQMQRGASVSCLEELAGSLAKLTEQAAGSSS